MASTDHSNVEREDPDVNVRAVVVSAIVFVVVAAAIHGLIWLLFLFFSTREAGHTTRQYPLAPAQESRLPPEPRLQTNPRQDLRDLGTAEDQTLKSYQWIDRNGGVVRIPIDEAIKLTLQRGLPARQAPQQEVVK